MATIFLGLNVLRFQSTECHHWFRQWLTRRQAITWAYVGQFNDKCIHHHPYNKLAKKGIFINQWNFNQNSYIFIEENAFQNVVWKMATIFLGLNVLRFQSTECHHWFRQWLTRRQAITWAYVGQFNDKCIHHHPYNKLAKKGIFINLLQN